MWYHVRLSYTNSKIEISTSTRECSLSAVADIHANIHTETVITRKRWTNEHCKAQECNRHSRCTAKHHSQEVSWQYSKANRRRICHLFSRQTSRQPARVEQLPCFRHAFEWWHEV